jgi:hypothetical protein
MREEIVGHFQMKSGTQTFNWGITIKMKEKGKKFCIIFKTNMSTKEMLSIQESEHYFVFFFKKLIYNHDPKTTTNKL